MLSNIRYSVNTKYLTISPSEAATCASLLRRSSSNSRRIRRRSSGCSSPGAAVRAQARIRSRVRREWHEDKAQVLLFKDVAKLVISPPQGLLFGGPSPRPLFSRSEE